MPIKVLIIGKLPPPYMGPAIATKILLESELKGIFNLIHFNSSLNKNIETLGRLSIGKVFKNIGMYFRYFNMARVQKPNVILVPISQSRIGFFKDAIYILLGALFGKVIIHLRGSNIRNWIDNENRLIRQIFSFTLKRTTGVIVLGHNLKHLFEPYFTEDNIFVAPNGGNYSLPKREASQKPIRVFYLGNLQETKGVVDVIESAKFLSNKNEVEFVLLGGWREKQTEEYCLKQINEHQLPITVLPPELSANKLNYLVNSDIFLFPPRAPEGHPWVIVEAMAAGLPIISTDKGAIIESVQDGINGYIVPHNQPKQIAHKIDYLISNPDIREKMGTESRRLYEEKFTEQRMVENLTHIFNTVHNQ